MNSAFSMLLAPMTRDSACGGARSCTTAYSGTAYRPPNRPRPARSTSSRSACGCPRNAPTPGARAPPAAARPAPDRARTAVSPMEPNGTSPISTLLAREPLAQQRAAAHRHRQHHQHQRDDARRRCRSGQARQLREQQRAVEPEPGQPEERQEYRARGARRLEVGARRRPGIEGRCASPGAAGGRRGIAQARAEPRQRDGRAAPRPRRPRWRGRPAVRHRACRAGSRRRCPSREQRVAADQLARPEHLRQQAVLGGREEGGVRAHEEHGSPAAARRCAAPGRARRAP